MLPKVERRCQPAVPWIVCVLQALRGQAHAGCCRCEQTQGPCPEEPCLTLHKLIMT